MRIRRQMVDQEHERVMDGGRAGKAGVMVQAGFERRAQQEHIVDQQCKRRLNRRLRRAHQLQRGMPDRRNRALQRGDEVAQHEQHIAIALVQRQPRNRLRLAGRPRDPGRKQRRLAPAGRSDIRLSPPGCTASSCAVRRERGTNWRVGGGGRIFVSSSGAEAANVWCSRSGTLVIACSAAGTAWRCGW